MTLQVWDPVLAANRPARQEDIDILQAKVNAFGQMIVTFSDITKALGSTVQQIHNQYRVSDELSQ